MTTSLAASVPVAWLVARAAGVVALGLLTLSTWLGLGMSTRLLGPRRMKPLLAWHRTLVWTGLSVIGLHVVALVADRTIHFGVAAVLVPFVAPWHPAAVAAGVTAGWLMLMVALSFRARKWIGQRGWRRLHYLGFAVFALGLGHALFVGTDLRGVGGPLVAALALGPTLWLVFVRILAPAPKPQLQPA